MSKNLSVEQQRVSTVLRRMLHQVESDPKDAEMYAGELEILLSDLANEDAFGTEAQKDPRGDHREGEWSMSHVEGVDE